MGFAVQRLPLPEHGRQRFQLTIPTDLSQVGDAVEAVVDCCRAAGALSSRLRFRLRTVTAEALANAIRYGNRNDPARWVTVEIEVDENEITLAVTDEGRGFDPRSIAAPCDDDHHEITSGRGLFMIRHLAEQVTFNERGNTIWMTLTRH